MEIVIDATDDLYGSEADSGAAARLANVVAHTLRDWGHRVRIADQGEYVRNHPWAQDWIDLAYERALTA